MAEAVSRSIRNLRRRQNTHFRSPPNGAGSLFPSQCLLIEFGLSRLIVQPTLVFEFFLKEVNASLFPPPKPAFDEFFVTGMLSLSYMLMCATSYTSNNLGDLHLSRICCSNTSQHIIGRRDSRNSRPGNKVTLCF